MRIPGIGRIGVDIKSALLGVAGMMGATYAVNRIAAMQPAIFNAAGPQHSGKLRGLATMLLGSMGTKYLPIPAGMKSSFSLGAQIAGARMILAEVAPAQFGAMEVPITDALGAYYQPEFSAAEWEPVADATL